MGTETTINPSQRYLSVAQTADYFGISERLVRGMIAAGELPSLKIRARVLVPRTAIDALESALHAEGGA